MKLIPLVLVVLMSVVIGGSTYAPDTWITVTPAQLSEWLRQQAEAEELCRPLMPVSTADGIECREPTDDWWPGQP